jgi:hypothetical protein
VSQGGRKGEERERGGKCMEMEGEKRKNAKC